MGYTTYYAPNTVKELHTVIVSDYINSGFKVLRHTLNGNYGILALESPRKHKFVCVIFYRVYNGKPSFKELPEDCAPFYYDVPNIYIELTKDSDHEREQYAKKWRANVVKRNEEKKAANEIYKKLPIGYELTFGNTVYHAYNAKGFGSEYADGKLVTRASDGAVFKASKKQFIDAIIEKLKQ